jgi:hypothetical protein
LRALPCLILPLLLVACDKSTPVDPGEDTSATPEGDDTGGDNGAGDDGTGDDSGGSGDDTGAPDDTGGPAGDTDTDDTAPPAPDEAAVEGMSARLHEDFGSLVYVSWEQTTAASVYVEYGFDDEWYTSPTFSAGPGAYEQILVGIPYGLEVTWRIANDFGDGAILFSDDATITTDDLPAGCPDAVTVSGDPALWDSDIGYFFIGMHEPGYWAYEDWWTFLVDREGRVVWARETEDSNVSVHPRIAYDQDAFLIDVNTFWGQLDGGAASEVLRVRIDGTIEHRYAVPGLHHPFTQLADGSVAWGALDDRGDETIEIVDLDGVQETVFDCADFMDSVNERGACTSNTLSWYEPTDSFVFSLYTHEAVIEVDHATGEALRWFGHINGVYDFAPEDSAFWWQHGACYTDAGTLLLSTKDRDRGDETLVREYTIDDGSRSLVELWSFGEGEGVYGYQLGEAHRLPGGNTLHNYGADSRLREITPAGEVVWDIEWESSQQIGRSTPVGDLWAFVP